MKDKSPRSEFIEHLGVPSNVGISYKEVDYVDWLERSYKNYKYLSDRVVQTLKIFLKHNSKKITLEDIQHITYITLKEKEYKDMYGEPPKKEVKIEKRIID